MQYLKQRPNQQGLKKRKSKEDDRTSEAELQTRGSTKIYKPFIHNPPLQHHRTQHRHDL